MCVVDLERLRLTLYRYEVMSMMFLGPLDDERALTWAGPRPVRSRSPRTSPPRLPRLPSSTSSEPFAPYSRSLEPAKNAVAHRASDVNLTLRALRLASLSFGTISSQVSARVCSLLRSTFRPVSPTEARRVSHGCGSQTATRA